MVEIIKYIALYEFGKHHNALPCVSLFSHFVGDVRAEGHIMHSHNQIVQITSDNK